MEYEYVDDQAEVKGFRKHKAVEFERMAILAEIEGEQFAAASKRFPDNTGLAQNARFHRDNAKTQRKVSDQVVKHAGVDRREFIPDLLADLRDRLRNMEADHVRNNELLEHAKVYDQPTEEVAVAVAVLEGGILALRKARDQLEKDLDSPKPSG